MAMQGSAISNCDFGSVTIKLSDEGFYNVIVGCTDMGTGCDTIIAQFVADSLDTDIDNIAVFGVDTDTSPYDSGSYASSTTYLTGMAAVKAAEQMREKLLQLAAKILEEDITKLEFDGKRVFCEETGKEVGSYLQSQFPGFAATVYGCLCRSGSRSGNRSHRTFGLHGMCGLWNGCEYESCKSTDRGRLTAGNRYDTV